MDNLVYGLVEVERLEQIAEWWSVNGEESIRSSRGGPYFPGPWGVSTRKNDKVYLHVFRWPANGELTFPNLKNRSIDSARLLNDGLIDIKQYAENFSIKVAEKSREKIVTTIELDLNENIMEIEPVYAQTPLTNRAKLTSSHNQENIWKVNDHDANTSWHASLSKGESEIWIEASFENEVTIASVVAGRGDEWSPRNTPEIQIPDGKGGWTTVFTWKPKWEPVKFLDQPVTTDKIRLRITGTNSYYLAEFELYAPL